MPLYCYLQVMLRSEPASFMCSVCLVHSHISLPSCRQEPLVFRFSFLLSVPSGLRQLLLMACMLTLLTQRGFVLILVPTRPNVYHGALMSGRTLVVPHTLLDVVLRTLAPWECRCLLPTLSSDVPQWATLFTSVFKEQNDLIGLISSKIMSTVGVQY